MSKSIRVKNFHIKNFQLRASVWILKTPIISKQGKNVIIISNHVKIMEEMRRESCIRGNHIYKEIWDPTIGEVVQCEREPRNSVDQYSVAITKRGVVVGHFPRRIYTQAVVSLFATRRNHWLCHNWSEKILCRSSTRWPRTSLLFAPFSIVARSQTQRDQEI